MSRRSIDEKPQGVNETLLGEVEKILTDNGIAEDQMIALRPTIRLAHSRNPRLKAIQIADMVSIFFDEAEAKNALKSSEKEQALFKETQADWNTFKGRQK